MRSFIVIIGMAALVLQCKPPESDQYTLTLENLIGRADSLNQLISSLQIDSFQEEMMIVLEELNSFREAALENDSIEVYRKEMDKYHVIYAGIDSCMQACVDFFDEIHLVQYELEHAKMKYVEGKIEKSRVDTVIIQEGIHLHEIKLRLSDKIDLLMGYRKEAEAVDTCVRELFRRIYDAIE